jgi:hypothetical protein
MQPCRVHASRLGKLEFVHAARGSILLDRLLPEAGLGEAQGVLLERLFRTPRVLLHAFELGGEGPASTASANTLALHSTRCAVPFDAHLSV